MLVILSWRPLSRALEIASAAGRCLVQPLGNKQATFLHSQGRNTIGRAHGVRDNLFRVIVLILGKTGYSEGRCHANAHWAFIELQEAPMGELVAWPGGEQSL